MRPRRLVLLVPALLLVLPLSRGTGEAVAARRVSAARPLLAYGSRGPAVRTVQRLLRRHGYPVPVTGWFGPITRRQVRRFQAANGIPATGRVGPLTWPALLGAPRRAAAGGGAVVYLTFDDGPSPTFTPRVLGLLARRGQRATFFVVGRSAAAHPALVRREYAAGNGVGNHTFDHVALRGLDPRRLVREVGAASAAIRRATGAAPRCLRPPYGSLDAAAGRRVAALGLRVVRWDVDPRDWRRPGAGAIAARVLARLRPGAVVLLHDGGGDRSQTVAALAVLLDALAARGWRSAALCRG